MQFIDNQTISIELEPQIINIKSIVRQRDDLQNRINYLQLKVNELNNTISSAENLGVVLNEELE
jgi:hypothetical protein